MRHALFVALAIAAAAPSGAQAPSTAAPAPAVPAPAVPAPAVPAPAVPAPAVPAPAVPAPALVDPARLTAARRLMEQVMPPPQREAMIRGMVGPIADNVRATMLENPGHAAAFGNDPRVREAIVRFTDRILKEAMASVEADMPKLMDAMAVAYARQFSVAQLDEVRAFYTTPTGRDFMARMPAVLADPAVTAAQRAMMATQLARIPTLTQEFTAELEALGRAGAGK